MKGKEEGREGGRVGSGRMGRRKDQRARFVGRGKRGDWREAELSTFGGGGGRAENVNNVREDPKKCRTVRVSKGNCDEVTGNQKQKWKEAQPNGQEQRAQGTAQGQAGREWEWTRAI